MVRTIEENEVMEYCFCRFIAVVRRVNKDCAEAVLEGFGLLGSSVSAIYQSQYKKAEDDHETGLETL